MVCTKRSFINKHEAKMMLQSTKESPSRLRRECRSYKCDKCRCYHLTSQTLEEYEAELDANKRKSQLNSVKEMSR